MRFAHFQTLCSLGLDTSQALMAMAPAIREIVPAQWTRIGLIENGMPGIGYAEHPDFVPYFIKVFEDIVSDSTAVVSHWAKHYRKQHLGYALTLQNAAYFDSKYYLEFERRFDSHWLLDTTLHVEGETFAGTVLTRSRLAKPFNDADIQNLARLRPWIAFALRRRSSQAPGGLGDSRAFRLSPATPCSRGSFS